MDAPCSGHQGRPSTASALATRRPLTNSRHSHRHCIQYHFRRIRSSCGRRAARDNPLAAKSHSELIHPRSAMHLFPRHLEAQSCRLPHNSLDHRNGSFRGVRKLVGERCTGTLWHTAAWWECERTARVWSECTSGRLIYIDLAPQRQIQEQNRAEPEQRRGGTEVGRAPGGGGRGGGGGGGQ